MIVTQTVNVHLDKQTPVTVETVQSDTGRGIRFRLFTNGEALDIKKGVTGFIRYSICHEGEYYTSCYDTLPDGSAAVVNQGTHVTVYLIPEIFSIVGVGELQVCLVNMGEVTTTMSVLLRVQRNLSIEGMTPAVRTDLTRFIQDQVHRQISVSSEQDNRLDDLHHREATAYAVGSLNSGDGAEVDSTTRIRSGFILHGGREITVTLSQGLKARCFFYDRNHSYVNESVFYEKTFTVHNPNAYVRIVAGYADDRTVGDTAALAGQVGIFYGSSGFDGFRGHVKALGYSTFAQCNAQGYYQFAGADVASISDAPPITVGGILEVHPHGGTNVTFQTIRTTDHQIWFRWGSYPFRRLVPQQERLKWYALGDSITQGYYSDESGLSLNPDKGWAAVAAAENGWSLTNLAVGGSGYVHAATVGDGLNARDHVDTIDFSGAELVTLSFGVNDWKYNCPLGSMSDDVFAGGTLYSNMRYCIEKILADQPCAKVVVLSPVNCSAYGTKDGNWGAGYGFAAGTLEDICQAEREICAYYGIQFLDLLHNSTVNRLNAPALLPDGVHPNPACHRLLGIELARKLL